MALRPLRFPLINGVGYSWASIHVRISCESTGKSLDLDQTGYSKIDYDVETDVGVAYGPHPDPLFQTRGQNKYTASISFYKSTLTYIKQEVLGGPGYRDRRFSVEVQFLEEGLDPVTIDIQGCRIGSEKSPNAKGVDPSETEVDLKPMRWMENGIDGADIPLAA